MSEPPGPQQGQQNGSQIEARRRYETKSCAANGSIRNRRMCRRTAVPPQTSLFRRFKAMRGTEWDYREGGWRGGGGGQTEWP